MDRGRGFLGTWFWATSFCLSLIVGLIVPFKISAMVVPVIMTVGIAVPMIIAHYWSFIDQAISEDFGTLAVMFVIYMLVLLAFQDDPVIWISICLIIFFVLMLETNFPNGLFYVRNFFSRDKN